MNIKYDYQAWDKIYREQGIFFKKPHEDMPRLVKLFKKKKCKRILDLGCGTGRHIIYLARKGFTVNGIDNSKKALQITRVLLKKYEVKAKLSLGNIYKRLPYKNEFFDAIISVQVIHHGKIEDIKKLIGELERIIKKNGILFITTIKRKPGSRFRHKEIEPNTIILSEGGEKGLPHHFFTNKEIKRLFRKFRITDSYMDSTNHFCFWAEKL